MQKMGEIDRKDADHWIEFNCKFCRASHLASCSLYETLINSKKEDVFEANTLECPWLEPRTSGTRRWL
jgi:hypothetical protein